MQLKNSMIVSSLIDSIQPINTEVKIKHIFPGNHNIWNRLLLNFSFFFFQPEKSQSIFHMFLCVLKQLLYECQSLSNYMCQIYLHIIDYQINFQMISQKIQTVQLKGSVFRNSQTLLKLINQNVKLKQMIQSNLWEQTHWSQVRNPLCKSKNDKQPPFWQIIFINCIETQVEEIYFKLLFLGFDILQVIQQIKFTNLKKLSLQQLYLDNIYPIQFLYAPNLQQLSLDTNRIKNVKPLKKTNFRKLKQLYLFLNPIKNIQHICRMALPLTQSLVIQNNQMEGSVIGQDISYLFKLQPKKLKNYGTFLWKRIRQKKLTQMLKIRYKSKSQNNNFNLDDSL